MKLSEEEKRCLELIIKWDQRVKGVNVERNQIIKQLGIDDSAYKPLMKKMEEICAVHNVARGMGQEYGEYFKISEPALLQDIWQMIEDE